MKHLILAVVFLVVLGSSSIPAGELRYVVRYDCRLGYAKCYGGSWGDNAAFWPSKAVLDQCIIAIVNGTEPDQKRLCNEKVNSLKTGTRVELLDSRECAPLVGIRALVGPLSGQTGCVPAEALSSIKP